MENSKHYRVRTSMDDKVLPINLNQDVDFIDVLSVKLGTKDAYRLHASNHGVLIGRVLANDAFGIPNAKVSIFIPRDNGDGADTNINKIYPFTNVLQQDENGVRYNLLDENIDEECHQDVGTFPSKRRVLDNGDVLYVYDKYLRYTTVTNSAGDYMIYGVPTGNQQLHIDIDLSDIGILSQKPRDMVANGHIMSEFENPNQFKSSKNLNSLAQIITEDRNVYIYPFWGDESYTKVSVSRSDVHVNYKFEPTCVFMGSIVTDNEKHSISNKCRPNRKSGYNRNLVTSSGTIEMIRKTPGGYVEEHQIQGTQLINGDGVWCYQIPMNLDYVGTDEYGNIIPTDNPKRGIPTRTRVRFRISVNENHEEGISRHRAKMLVPNIAEISGDQDKPYTNDDVDKLYIFGSDTPESQFRDLYWNKVYTVKSYIPRLQTAKNFSNYDKFIGIKKTNDEDGKNPIPFNSLRVRTPFLFSLICRLSSIIASIVYSINLSLTLVPGVICVTMSGISDDGIYYAPGCSLHKRRTAKKLGVSKDKINGKLTDAVDAIQTNLAEDADVVNLDFVNDWLNGCMYMPLFHYKGTRKWKLFGIPFSHTSKKRFCSCDREVKRMRLYENCSMGYTTNDLNYRLKGQIENRREDDAADEREYVEIKHGVIKEFLNNDNIEIYYYSHGVKEGSNFYRLYSNDIVLLGSFNECDMDGMPQLFKHIPVTTANIPEIEGERDEDTGNIENSGMDWGSHKDYRSGLFTNIKCGSVDTLAKSCVNAKRMCELGVDYDMAGNETILSGGIEYDIPIKVAGGITSKDLPGTDARSMFATLNTEKLVGNDVDLRTGYKKYKLDYVYTYDFDGMLSSAKGVYSDDFKDKSYIKFRFGGNKPHFYKKTNGVYRFPLFENSFYFYFGLNHGKTAMDLFHENYYSKCLKHTEEEMGVSIALERSAKVCVETEDELGKIVVDVSNVQMPCDCSLIVNGEYIITQNDFTGRDVSFTGLTNNNYTVEVVDTNGKVFTKDVTLSYGEFGAIINASDLGRKYIEGEEIIYSEWDEEGTNGLISISGISCDHKEHQFTNGQLIEKSKTDNEATFLYKNDELGNTDLYIKIALVDFTWEECTDIDKGMVVDGCIYIPFYKPVEVTVKTSAVCPNGGEPYETTETVNILNGKDFNGEMNGMPLEFMKNKWYGENITVDELDSTLDVWSKPNDPNSFSDSFNATYNDGKWENYIEGLPSENTDERKNMVVEYKLNTLISLSNGVMSSNDGLPHKPTLTTLGGNDTIVRYSGPNMSTYDDYDKVNDVVIGTKSLADTYPDTPMLVTGGDGKLNFTTKYTGFENKLNQLYYFAAFTNKGEGVCQKIPDGAVNILSVKSDTTKIMDVTPGYVMSSFIAMPNIDRRLKMEHGGWIVFPVNNDDVIDSKTNNIENYSGNMLFPVGKGVKMAYRMDDDGKYELVGDEYEWSYDENGVLAFNEGNRKSYYSIEFNNDVLKDASVVTEYPNHDDIIIPSQIIWDKRNDAEFVFDATACSYNTNAFITEDGHVQAYATPGDSLTIEMPLNRNVIDFIFTDDFDANCVYDKNGEDESKRNVHIKLSDTGILADRICKPMIVPYDGELFANIMKRFNGEVMSDGSDCGSGFIKLSKDGDVYKDTNSGFKDVFVNDGDSSNIRYCVKSLQGISEGYYSDSNNNAFDSPVDEITLSEKITWIAKPSFNNEPCAIRLGNQEASKINAAGTITGSSLQTILIQKVYFMDNDPERRFKTYNMSTVLDFRPISIEKKNGKVYILKENGTENITILKHTDSVYTVKMIDGEKKISSAKTRYIEGSGLEITSTSNNGVSSIYLQTSNGMRYEIKVDDL